MKRKSTVNVRTDFGPIKTVINANLEGLTRGEQQVVVDRLTDGIAGLFKDLPYVGRIPLRDIAIA